MNIKIFSYIPVIWHNLFNTSNHNIWGKMLASLVAFSFCTWVFVKWNTINEFEDFVEVENLIPDDSVKILSNIHIGYDFSMKFNNGHIESPFKESSTNHFEFVEIEDKRKDPLDSVYKTKIMLDIALGKKEHEHYSNLDGLSLMDSLRGLYYVRMLRYGDLKQRTLKNENDIVYDKNYELIDRDDDDFLIRRFVYTDQITFEYKTDSIWDFDDLLNFKIAHTGFKFPSIWTLLPDSVRREIAANDNRIMLINPQNFNYKSDGSQYEFFVLNPVSNLTSPSASQDRICYTRPHLLSLYDISQAYFSVYVRSASIDTLKLRVSYNGAVNIYPVRPDATILSQNGVEYHNRLHYSSVYYYTFLTKFPELEGLQQVRTFLLGAILTLFLTLITKYIWQIIVGFSFTKKKQQIEK